MRRPRACVCSRADAPPPAPTTEQVIEFPTQPGQACVVHLPPLPGKPVPAAAAAPVGGTSRQQQMHQKQAQAAAARTAPGHRAGPPHAPAPAGAAVPFGGIAIPGRPADGLDSVAEARLAMVAAAGGGFSFKSSYGSLMDATGLNAYMEARGTGQLAGESPLTMHAFAVPGVEQGGQQASFPRSLGPLLGDVMDLGSPAWSDGR